MATRLIADAINVASIAPGAFASETNRVARDHGDAISKFIPSRRTGVDEDMAGAAIYLASSAGDYVVGDTITVDGGVAMSALELRRSRYTISFVYCIGMTV
jgi:NAD(P)-dependent dehydrogenase (short-subunit alcohol dehydrogenase family)